MTTHWTKSNGFHVVFVVEGVVVYIRIYFPDLSGPVNWRKGGFGPYISVIVPFVVTFTTYKS